MKPLLTPLIPMFLAGCQLLTPETWPEHSDERQAMRQVHIETRKQVVDELQAEQSVERAALRQRQAAEVALNAAKTAKDVKEAREELLKARQELVKALTD